jgi:hypothetical protein
MEVTDWKRLTANPITIAVSRIGAASVTALVINILSKSVA